MTPYVPTPIPTEGVTLPPELEALVELLAENSHDWWALNRIEAGWTYGPKRDDGLKSHPDLVAYADLPEGEKNLDRTHVTEVFKAITVLGYVIAPG